MEDAQFGCCPKDAGSTVLTVEEEAVIVVRTHTLLPLDDYLYSLQPTIPHPARGLQRHGISRLPQVEGEASPKRKFKDLTPYAFICKQWTSQVHCKPLRKIPGLNI